MSLGMSRCVKCGAAAWIGRLKKALAAAGGWVPFRDLRLGAIFKLEDGSRWVKADSPDFWCVSLVDGSCLAILPDGDNALVREINLPFFC